MHRSHQYGWSGSTRPFLKELQKKTWNPQFPCAGYILRRLMLFFYFAAHASEYSHCSTWPLQIWYLCAALLCGCYDPIYLSYPCWYYVVLMKLTLSSIDVSMSDWATTGREEFVMNSAFAGYTKYAVHCTVIYFISPKNQLYKTLWFNITSQTSFYKFWTSAQSVKKVVFFNYMLDAVGVCTQTLLCKLPVYCVGAC